MPLLSLHKTYIPVHIIHEYSTLMFYCCHNNECHEFVVQAGNFWLPNCILLNEAPQLMTSVQHGDIGKPESELIM